MDDSGAPATQLSTLLRSKNRCLQRFCALSHEFLELTAEGGFAALEAALPAFESGREAIVRAIGLYERQIERVIQGLGQDSSENELPTGLRDELKGLMADGESALAEVLRLDDEIVARIEGGREELCAEVVAHERNQATMEKLRKFRSSWVAESGEELDRKL